MKLGGSNVFFFFLMVSSGPEMQQNRTQQHIEYVLDHTQCVWSFASPISLALVNLVLFWPDLGQIARSLRPHPEVEVGSRVAL